MAVAENLTPCDIASEGISISDAPNVYAALHPALIKYAQHELMRQGLSAQEAEDVVQDASESWFELISTEARAYAYMRKAIDNRIRDRFRPRRDAMTRHPLSLDEITG